MRIEFYLVEPMLVSHYAPIIRALRAMGVDAVFVSARGSGNTVGTWYDADEGEALVARTGLPVVHRPDPRADLAVCYGDADLLLQYRHKRARIMYGCGVAGDSTHLRKDRYRNYDLVLVHGPFHRRLAVTRIQPRRVAVMGYPRYDDWFNGVFDHAGARTRLAVGGAGKPVLLYLPTWQHRSSLDRFTDAVFSLADKFEIVVKPHHCTQAREPERMARLRGGPVALLNALVDPQDAYAAANLVLGDLTSGAFVEPLLLRRKVIGLGGADERASIFHPRVADVIPICTEPGLLRDMALRVCAEPIGEAAEGLRADLFGTTEGYDAHQAAEAMVRAVLELPPAARFLREEAALKALRPYAIHAVNYAKIFLRHTLPDPLRRRLKEFSDRRLPKT